MSGRANVRSPTEPVADPRQERENRASFDEVRVRGLSSRVDSGAMTDRDLLHDLCSDRVPSAEAYERLLDAYGEELYRRCVLSLCDRDAAHVVLRDTLIAARAHIRRLPDADRMGEWLHAVAESECLRRRARDHRLAREWALPVNIALVRARVLKGMAAPELDGYRAHVAARADNFGRDGFPAPPSEPGGRNLPCALVPALTGLLVALACAAYALAEASGPLAAALGG